MTDSPNCDLPVKTEIPFGALHVVAVAGVLTASSPGSLVTIVTGTEVAGRGHAAGRIFVAAGQPPADTKPLHPDGRGVLAGGGGPVLSESSTSTTPSSSTAGRWMTLAYRCASGRAPTDLVTDSTAGSATGAEAMVSTSANLRVCCVGLPSATTRPRRRAA